MATLPLQHLTEQSAGVGAWMLKVAMEPQEISYTWTQGGQNKTGRKLEFVLVSEDSTKYCQGLIKRWGKEPTATQNFDAAKRKFQKGTAWKVSKVSLVKQVQKYLGCSCKIVIDMNKSKFEPVLQSMVKMPMQATPPEDLATLLECHEDQVVDVIALVAEVSQPVQKTTAHGERLMVEVTIMDDSGKEGAASCRFTAWFPKGANTAQCSQLQNLIESVASQKPLVFFNLVAQKEKTMDSASELQSMEMPVRPVLQSRAPGRKPLSGRAGISSPSKFATRALKRTDSQRMLPPSSQSKAVKSPLCRSYPPL